MLFTTLRREWRLNGQQLLNQPLHVSSAMLSTIHDFHASCSTSLCLMLPLTKRFWHCCSIERISKDALAGALRRHNLAARATSVYLEHFFNHKSRSIVEEVVAKFTLDTITINWNAEKLCKRRFMRIGLSEEDMPTRFPSRGMAWQAPVPPRVWRSSTRCGLGSWYLRLAM